MLEWCSNLLFVCCRPGWCLYLLSMTSSGSIDSMVDASTDKRLDQWNQNSLPQTPPPPYDSIPSQSPSQSRGSSHVSIHTVTLCGEDDLSHCSLSLGYPHEPGCEMCSAGREQARYSEESQSVVLMLNKNLESLDLSLSSLNLTQELDKDVLLSGDGYPHIDLDTIDSGFGECSSPAASGPSAELCEHYQSNYVKQWTISHDSGWYQSNPDLSTHWTPILKCGCVLNCDFLNVWSIIGTFKVN